MDFIYYRIACDSWLMLEFPVSDNGQALLMKATKLRNKWDFLLNQQLQGIRCIPFNMIKLYFLFLPFYLFNIYCKININYLIFQDLMMQIMKLMILVKLSKILLKN